MNNIKRLFISAVLLGGGIGANADQIYGPLSVVDAEIADCRAKINSLRARNPGKIDRMLQRDKDCRYVTENAPEIDGLRRENARILARACEIVRSNNPLAVTSNTTMVFMLYSSRYPQVASLRRAYDMNRRRIAKYDKSKLQLDTRIQAIKNHCDSIMYAEIDKQHQRLDSLLNLKLSLIQQHIH